MGLDITAYSKLEQVDDAVFDEDADETIDRVTGEKIDAFLPCVNPDFPTRADNLVDRGAYRVTGNPLSFRAGSYGGYNLWRDELAALAGFPDSGAKRGHAESAWKAASGPFYELINFSDCEGTIGPLTSAKLARDFAEYQAKADAHPDAYFRELYRMWRKAFELAANDGAVDFH